VGERMPLVKAVFPFGFIQHNPLKYNNTGTQKYNNTGTSAGASVVKWQRGS